MTGMEATSRESEALTKETHHNQVCPAIARSGACALQLACGLRRHEAVALTWDHIQQREEHWAIVDLVGKGGHIRTVPLPDWVRNEVNDWLVAAAIDSRTCARLCHASGGELEQIQSLLGHISVQTTERYLGCKQRIRSAVNDCIGIEPSP
jgi:integrase